MTESFKERMDKAIRIVDKRLAEVETVSSGRSEATQEALNTEELLLEGMRMAYVGLSNDTDFEVVADQSKAYRAMKAEQRQGRREKS